MRALCEANSPDSLNVRAVLRHCVPNKGLHPLRCLRHLLEAECITLRQEIEVQERQNENIEKFIQTAHKYVGIDELDGYTLRELVSAIYVDAPDKSSGKRVQHIHIKYDGLGFIPLNELMKEETA